jgi:predicted XRE-type DNA-binding protein
VKKRKKGNEKKAPVRLSKASPPGYPTELDWKIITKKSTQNTVSKILAPPANPVLLLKQKICEEFIKYRLKENINQRELAKRLDVTESRVSEILHYHHERFTVDKLLELLNRVKPGLTLKIA